MIEFAVEADIARPVSEVFAFATDPKKLSNWQTNTVSALPEDDGPLQLGSRIHEVHRGPGGRELKSIVEVSEYKLDQVFALRMIEGALPIDGRLLFESVADGTRVHFTVHGRPSGAMRIVQPLLRLALKRQFSEHVSTLKAALESSTQPCSA